MKKKIISFLLVGSFFLQVGLVNAVGDPGSAKQDWLSAVQARSSAAAEYKQAQADYAAAKTPENADKVLTGGKSLFRAVLDEAETWLNWKNAEAQADPRVSSDEIKQNIENDVNKNIAKINSLRAEVDSIDNMVKGVVVFLKITGAYAELLTDVARNVGYAWVQIGNGVLETAQEYESKLRSVAESVPDNAQLLEKLDLIKTELNNAGDKINAAKSSYAQVKIPGNPLVKFGEGNNYLVGARSDLLSAYGKMQEVFNSALSKK